MKMKCLLLLLMLATVSNSTEKKESADRWTWLYRKTCTPKERERNNEKSIALFAKESVPEFTQLLFSWNAMRPAAGYFSFFVQARNAATKRWGNWHHMIDWGAQVQRSYLSKSDGIARYEHVRLELENDMKADAFRIKIAAHDGADLSFLHGFAVALSNYALFKPESPHHALEQVRSVYLPDVPRIAQFAIDHEHNARICSPTSCTMLTRYLTGESIDPIDFAMNVYDTGLDAYGSWPFNMAHAFERSNGLINFFVARFNSVTDIHRQLIRGIPVVVSVRGVIDGAPKPYPHGHLLVVIGLDTEKKAVICHDPASDDDETIVKQYAVESFMRAWERSRRLAYWAEPK